MPKSNHTRHPNRRKILTAISIGGKTIYDAKAKQLILDNKGHVGGVKAETPDGIVD